MKVDLKLTKAFEGDFEKLLSQFCSTQNLTPDENALVNERFIARSLIPHVRKLSELFNRLEKPTEDLKIDPYWKKSSNAENLRLAYFSYFMPPNIYRMASVLGELHRLGYRMNLKTPKLKTIEWGAGPASGSSGVLVGQKYTPIFESMSESTQNILFDFALIEQDRSILKLGEAWVNEYSKFLGSDSFIRPFHRKVNWKESLLPPAAPKFNLWLSSFFLNEFLDEPSQVAEKLIENWTLKLEEEALIIIVEPALKLQSRKLLKLREELIKKLPLEFKVLLPCLGHQRCGALELDGDWCHEEVSWWRPAYMRKIDELAGLDRKSLPFSYLVIAKSTRTRAELLPALKDGKSFHRQVSPSHYEGKDQEFYLCHTQPTSGTNSKRKTRLRTELELERGSIYIDATLRGDEMASRVDQFKSIL